MHRYRSSASSSRATPTTRCQKCLKLGHYTFECKVSAQEQPYISRPSRTQQLFNPKLQPKLGEAAPPNETNLLQKKGVADSILKQKEDDRNRDRGRKRQRDRSASPRRDRSLSASSATSYSTVSSTRSLSRSRSRRRSASRSRSHRRRRYSRSGSRSPGHERSVRRKYRDSPSPRHRGRKLSVSHGERRTRSRSPPRRVSGVKRHLTPPSQKMDYEPSRRDPSPLPPPRERSLSPFTRRRLMTEAMQRGA
ncbi:hypothetical protein EX30DRAFT_359148 [Ascodesmis nigricans]|uniref:Zinc knuckle-domain-containing protein n=1 Tax=Ascodesmis nigricans TaxID=341454 RepID=A0A4S2MV09_9PEZI|nr:hypothetical protein EX30DRAFT_359148 [Ascodesmis nigricans]